MAAISHSLKARMDERAAALARVDELQALLARRDADVASLSGRLDMLMALVAEAEQHRADALQLRAENERLRAECNSYRQARALYNALQTTLLVLNGDAAAKAEAEALTPPASTVQEA